MAQILCFYMHELKLLKNRDANDKPSLIPYCRNKNLAIGKSVREAERM